MSKGEKYAFVSGLSIMNEQDHVLTALVSNTPLNAVHMVVVTESGLAWERPDVEVLQMDMDWQKTSKKLMHIISKKPQVCWLPCLTKFPHQKFCTICGMRWICMDLE